MRDVTGWMFLIILTVFLSSCAQFSEEGASAGIDESAYEYVLPDLVGIDGLSAPSSVTVYRAEKPDLVLDDLRDSFLQMNRFSVSPIEESREDKDWVGMTCRTNSGEHPGMEESLAINKASNGIMYRLRCLENEEDNFWDCETMESIYALERFRNTGSVRSEKDPDDWMERDKEVVESCFRQMGMQNYRYMDGVTYRDTLGQEASIQFWTPFIDGIPVNVKWFAGRGQYFSRRRYNNELFDYNNLIQYDEEIGCGISVYVADGRVAVWDQPCCFTVSEAYREIPVVPVREALKKVEELYSPEEVSERRATLVLAELEYKCLEYEGVVYYFPLWTFAVSTYEKSLTPEIDFERDDLIMHGEAWTYYYINPATGEFFSTWDLGE